MTSQECLDKNGWCIIDYDTSDSELIGFSSKIGEIVPENNSAIHKLVPKRKGSGIKDSFSYNYGFASFPYHTDTAFWDIPVRYFVLASEKISECHTLLVDSSELFKSLDQADMKILEKAVFLLKTPLGSKFVSLLFAYDGKIVLRYDPNIMMPYNKYSTCAVDIINAFLIKVNPVVVEWTGKNIAIVDNWRMLHARAEYINEEQRILKRIYIK
ncbi:Fe(II)-2OG oxygenase family protein [Hymenobacter jeollabukensis]|uniref:TauD/TfdA family dioxygenase n=1 Tax=Hymenobacter jeollabukensis TaxID=2025313 RepID=A0A5R8WM18_9BACT|nr:TauD/TfdA family dioxygenase [Hymenobacter jeollabukensis]TLM89865.1 TauD/TfdA family dioxygenase [Hymenobacter jeollabukensis]